jgi:molecular chaperone GrpE (heat shock protein)
MMLLVLPQAKQIQIDDLFSKLDSSSAALEHLRDEKDQEIAILQEGMDSTIQQLSDAQQVRLRWSPRFV